MRTRKRVICKKFGGPEVLSLIKEEIPQLQSDEVLVKITSIGMNHAELMARRGEYKISSGEPPFTPGMEAGGIIEEIGEKVLDRKKGDRVVLSPGVTRHGLNGSYISHFICSASETLSVPNSIPNEAIGAIWLSFLTAWGCFSWKQNLQPGQTVLIPAASSSVGIAASQVVKALGGIAFGATSHPEKLNRLIDMKVCTFEHILTTENSNWIKQAKERI